jgi:nitrogen fixation protein FixH
VGAASSNYSGKVQQQVYVMSQEGRKEMGEEKAAGQLGHRKWAAELISFSVIVFSFFLD